MPFRIRTLLCASALVAGTVPLTTTPAEAVLASGFVDVGPIATTGVAVGLTDDDLVATGQGAWFDGSWRAAPTAAGQRTPLSPGAVTAAGTVIAGSNADTNPFTSVWAWHPRTGATSILAPCPATAGDQFPTYPEGIGAAGDGDEASVTFTVYGTGTACEGESGQEPVATLASTAGSAYTHVPGLYLLDGLHDGWAIGHNTSNQGILVDRSTGTQRVVQTDFADAPPSAQLGTDGSIVGADASGTHATIERPSGTSSTTITQLAAPSGLPYTAANAINANGVIAGDAAATTDENATVHLVVWSSATATPRDLSGQVPSGWTRLAPTYINARGDIAGTGIGPDGKPHVFLLSGHLSSSVTVTRADGSAYVQGSGARGDHLVAHVTLTNAAGSPTITGLTRDDALSVTPSNDLTIGTPTALSTTTLAAGASATYDVPLTVTGLGKATLHLAAHGSDPARQDTSLDQLLVLGSPLTVTYRFQVGGVDLSTTGNSFVLPDTDDGEVPTDIAVSEKITNGSGVTQHHVTPQPMDLLTVDPNAKHLPFPVTVTTGPSPSGDRGDLANGASTTVTWTLHVVKNIDLKVRDLVLSSSDGGATNDVSIGEDVVHVRPAHELLLKVTNDSGTAVVKTGHTFTLTGTVTNLDQSRALDLDPLLPTFTGNAGGQAALSDGTPTTDGFLPPVAGTLDPGEQKTFTVQSIKDAGTRGTVTWDPSGSVVQSDGTETALTATDVRLAAGTTPMDLHLDDSDPAPVPSTLLDRTQIFGASALEALRDWCGNGLHAIADWRGTLSSIGSGLVATGGIAVKDVQAFGVGVSFAKASVALTFFWDSLTDAQRQQFADEVALDAQATKDAWKDFHGSIDNAVFSFFSSYETAVAKGDLVTAAQLQGKAVGTGLPEVLSLFLPELIMNKVGRGLQWGVKVAGGIKDTSVARVISLGEKVRESRLVLKTAKGIEGAVAGSDLLANSAKVLRKQFGMARRDIDALTYWAKKNDLLIAVRQRSELSLDWLKKGAVNKPELVKIKNVDEIDTKYLGYLGKDEGSVILREPLDKKLVQAKIRSAPPELRSAIAKRYGVRVKEWKKYSKDYKKWSGTVQELGFDEAAQGVVGPKKAKPRRFELKKQAVHGGDEYYQVKIADAHGKMQRVTGDIDVVAITLADGRIPDAATRSKLYQDLQDAFGMQHGETLSWILKGELLSTTKAGLLADHLPGRELLAVFGPDGGCRAAYFDPRLTIFNQQTGEAAATFIGAYSTPLQRVTRLAGVSLAKFF